jgi:hypothetical protein
VAAASGYRPQREYVGVAPVLEQALDLLFVARVRCLNAG